MRRIFFLALVFAIAVSAVSCTPAYYQRSADRTVARLKGEKTAEILGGRREEVVIPLTQKVTDPPGSGEADASGDGLKPGNTESTELETAPAPKQVTLTVGDSLAMAFERNRDFRNQGESLYTSLLSFSAVLKNYRPRPSSSMGFNYNESDTSETGDRSESFSLGLSQILPTGGTLTFSGSASASHYRQAASAMPNSTTSNMSLSISQPLLRGFGKRQAYESLIQGERNVVYTIRDFELYRQQFAINVVQQFWSLVERGQGKANAKKNYESNVYLKRRSEALFKTGRVTKVEVMRAQDEERQAYLSYTSAVENYEDALDRFKVYLDLPLDTELTIVPDDPVFIKVEVELDAAIETAFLNRLDWKNAIEQLEDAERSHLLARNNTLPSLDMSASVSNSTSSRTSFRRHHYESESLSGSLSFEVPLENTDRRNSYANAVIGYERSKRNHRLQKENIILDVRSTVRSLRRAEDQIETQKRRLDSQEKRVRLTQIQFAQGGIQNRDVVEAQQALLNAKNSYIQSLVDYEIARITLLKNLGILFIDPEGQVEDIGMEEEPAGSPNSGPVEEAE